jgi:hypothetical protein
MTQAVVESTCDLTQFISAVRRVAAETLDDRKPRTAFPSNISPLV